MKIKQEEVQRVCRLVLEKLKEKKLITMKVKEASIYEALVETFLKNVEQEAAIDQEATRILDENTDQYGADVDRQKMYLLIKRKIAKERGFVL